MKIKESDQKKNEARIPAPEKKTMTPAQRVSEILFHSAELGKAHYHATLARACYGNCPIVTAHVELTNKYLIDDVEWDDIEALVVDIGLQLNTYIEDQRLWNWLFSDNYELIESWNS